MLNLFAALIKMDLPASLSEALTLLWQGMLGIFLVALFIIMFTAILNAVTKSEE